MNQYLIPFFGTTALEEISSFEIERFKKHCREQGLSTASVNRFLAVMSHLFNLAVKWGWINHAPCKVKKFREEANRITYLTPEQIQRLLDATKADSCKVIHPFIMIGLETSMRRMEILSIQIENIDLNRRIIFIPQAKAGAREQPIMARLVTFLRNYLKENTTPDQVWLFPVFY